MGFLDKLMKDVEKGVGRAQFEADKVMKTNALRSEVDKAKKAEHEILAEIGSRVVALQAAGEISLPGVEEELRRLEENRATLAAKEQELEQAQAMQFVPGQTAPAAPQEPAEMPQPESSPYVESSPIMSGYQTGDIEVTPTQMPATHTCPNCGADTPAGAVFCPECGFRMG